MFASDQYPNRRADLETNLEEPAALNRLLAMAIPKRKLPTHTMVKDQRNPKNAQCPIISDTMLPSNVTMNPLFDNVLEMSFTSLVELNLTASFRKATLRLCDESIR
jgi:hypothetical protein